MTRKEPMRDLGDAGPGAEIGGVIIWDLENDFVRIDAHLCSLFDVDQERGARGLAVQSLADLIGSDDIAAVFSRMKTLSSDVSPVDFGFTAMLADGSRTEVGASGQFFQDAANKPILFVGKLGPGLGPVTGDSRSALVAHCIEAYRLAENRNDVLLKHLLSMALIELGRTEVVFGVH